MNPGPKHPPQAAPDFPEDAKCRQCGYRLCGLPRNVCPECGLPFDPDKPITYHSPSLPNWLRQYGHPPRKLYTWIFLVYVMVALLDFSSPGPSKFIFCIWLPTSVLWALFHTLDWLLRLIARLIALRMPGAPPARPVRCWLWTPIILAILLSFFFYPWPAYLRFQLSRGAFEATIENLPASLTWIPENIGLYKVREVSNESNDCIFFDLGTEYLNRAGFWYIPTKSPMPTGPYYIKHRLAKNWYIGGKRL